ncbi:MAG: type II toxin-antitoxin system VapC family toxin [Thermomicrobiales bacterium]
MSYLLDTNVVIDLLRARATTVRAHYRQVVGSNEAIAISAITLFELRHRIAKSSRPEQNSAALNTLLQSQIEVIPFTDEDAPIAGELTAHLESQGRRIGPYDLLIAAQALRTGMTLVTANTSEFNRVPDLQWEDWTKTD